MPRVCCCAVLLIMISGGVVRGAALGVNLLTNGDAETDNLVGWSTTGPMATIDTAAVGSLGVPPGDSIGAFAFYGGLSAPSPSTSTMTQAVDVSDMAAAIDAGLLTSEFEVLVQSRVVGAVTDLVTGTLTFQDAGSGPLAIFQFSDLELVHNVFDWYLATDTRTVPAGTRSIEVSLAFSRSGGASTDAFADNASLVLTPEPASLALLALGALAAARRRSAQPA